MGWENFFEKIRSDNNICHIDITFGLANLNEIMIDNTNLKIADKQEEE